MIIEQLKDLKKKASTTLAITLIASVGILIAALITQKSEIIPFAVAPFLIGLIIVASLKAKFSKLFKTAFVADALKSTFENLVYTPEKGFDRNVIASTGMIRMGDRYSSNDYISGKYHNVGFEQSDLKIQEVHTYTDSKGQTHTEVENIFVGKWMIFDFNKNFQANIQVRTKNFYNSKLKTQWGGMKYQEVKMEDEAFNKQFKIYAQSEHEAFYILTPSFMEKLKETATGLGGRVMFCFIDNKLHIALNNSKDAFEYSIFGKLDEQVINDYVFKEIKLITDFVDKLSLENDIFK